MGKVWRAAKSILGLRMCTWAIPVAAESDDYELECDYPNVVSPPSTPGRISRRVSKGSCPICLEVLKTGSGQAIFTAECSHVFHFTCIASNVRHGNKICPVCRSNWKEVPWQAPQPSSLRPSERQQRSPSSSTSFSPVRSPLHHHLRSSPLHRNNALAQSITLDEEPDPVIRIIDESIANAQSNRPNPEPNSYDDDEPPVISSSNAANAEEEDGIENNQSVIKVSAFPEMASVSCTESRESFTVLVHVKAQQEQQQPTFSPSLMLDPSSRAPLDLVTVLDVSGSMAGTKLILLKRAMSFVIRNLSAQDRLSIIVFSSNAKRLFPLRPMVEEGRQFALRAMEALVSTGGTNIAEGLRKGAKVLEERRYKNPVASIMLLSDGQDTYSMAATIFNHHHHQHRYQKSSSPSLPTSRIPVHTFGFGADHDAATMHSIAEVSGGTFSFIQADDGVQDAFAQCVGGLLSVIVQDVKLRISAGDGGVQIKNIEAGSYRSSLCDDLSQGVVKLGDLYADEERDVLVELKLPAMKSFEEQNSCILQIGCTYRNPVRPHIHQTAMHNCSIARPGFMDADDVTSMEVDRQKNRFLTAQTIVEAGLLADAGDIEAAQRTLQVTRLAIQTSISSRAGDKLSEAFVEELGEIQVRIGNRQTYERTGRAYILSAQSSHFRQRATTRGNSVEGHSSDYQTPSMASMILRSQRHLCNPR